jgi:hypothetical protein
MRKVSPPRRRDLFPDTEDCSSAAPLAARSAPLPGSNDGRRDLLETISHGPRGDIAAFYTTFPWPALCEEVPPLRISPREGVVLDGDLRTLAIGLRPLSEMGANSHMERSPGGPVRVGTIHQAMLAVSRLELSGVTLKSLPFRQAEPVLGHRMDGILGHDFLSALVVQFDWGAGVVRVESPETFRAPSTAHSIPVRLMDSAAYVKAEILTAEGTAIPGEFKVDSGSADVAGLNNNFAEKTKVAPPDQRLPSPGTAVGGETKGYLFRAQGLRWGGLTVRDPLVGVTTDSAGFENRPDAGTLGTGSLSSFRVTFDYRRARLLVEARAGKEQPAQSDSSGLWIVASGPRLMQRTVKWVLPRSPAAEAGIRAGDRIVEISGASAEGMTVSRLRDLLLAPEEEYDLLLEGKRRVALRTRIFP